jgi:hypothetical protein
MCKTMRDAAQESAFGWIDEPRRPFWRHVAVTGITAGAAE